MMSVAGGMSAAVIRRLAAQMSGQVLRTAARRGLAAAGPLAAAISTGVSGRQRTRLPSTPPTPRMPERYIQRRRPHTAAAQDQVMTEINHMETQTDRRKRRIKLPKGFTKKMKKNGKKSNRRKGTANRTKRTRSRRRVGTKKKVNYADGGHVQAYETRGQAADLNACYLGGASVPGKAVERSIAHALIAFYYRKRNTCIHNWRDIPGDNVSYSFLYQNIGGSTSTTPTSTWVTTDSFDAAAGNIQASLTAIYGQAYGTDMLRIVNWNVYPTTGSIPPITIDMSELKFHFNSYMNITIQNQTLGQAGVGDNSIEAVDRMPLVGLLYSGKGNGTLFNDINRASTVPYSPLFGDENTGWIRKVALQDAGLTWNKPPPANVFDKGVTAKKITIESGAFFTFSVKGNIYGTIDDIWHKTYPQFSPQYYHKQGEFKFIGVEKKLNWATGAANQVLLTGEFKLTTKCKAVSGLKNHTMPQFNNPVTF